MVEIQSQKLGEKQCKLYIALGIGSVPFLARQSRGSNCGPSQLSSNIKPVPATTTVVDTTDFAKDTGRFRGALSGVVGVEAGRGG